MKIFLQTKLLMKYWLVAMLSGMVLISCGMTGTTSNDFSTHEKSTTKETVVYLTRHGEKQLRQTNDPHLSEKGLQTAQRLADYLNEKEINAIYSTPYNRTRTTAQAVSDSQNISISELYLPAHEMAQLLKVQHEGQHVLVVGHSNTTPALLKHLGVVEKITIDDDQFGQLFIVTLDAGALTRFEKIDY